MFYIVRLADSSMKTWCFCKLSYTQSTFPVSHFLSTDTTFTFSNICSSLDTVEDWGHLGKQLDIAPSKRGKQEMVNYYVTNIPASWELLAGVLYYLGEQRALTKSDKLLPRTTRYVWEGIEMGSHLSEHIVTGGCSHK